MYRSKKIAFIASFPGSLLNFRLQLMKAFIAKDYEVIAIAPADDEVEKKLLLIGVKLFAAPMERNGLNLFRDIFLCATLYSILRKEKPDIVFSYTVKPIVYGSIAAKLARIRRIYSLVTGTGYVFLNTNLKSKMVGIIASCAFGISLRCNNTVFFQNKDNLSLFLQRKMLSQKQSVIIVNGSGVDCQHYAPADYPDQVSFLMIARLLYDKGVHEYVQAAKLVKKKYPHVQFKLAGWIDTNPNAISQQQLDEWIQEGDIHFLGKLEDVRSAIADCAVYVLPSYHEGMPRSVLEAMAMARPIITTNASGCKETVMPHKNGFLVPIQDTLELIKSFEYFIEQPHNIKPMGIESRQLALEKFDVHKVNQTILEAILE